MSFISQLSRLSIFSGGCKNIVYGRNWPHVSQTCKYSRKSAEEKLGIEKPKRPLTPFFKFMSQMRPALLAKNPGITTKEAITWSSKHWQELDAETKAKMSKEYEKDLEDYKKIKELYEKSLTEEQKADILKMREEMSNAREKRKLKAEYKELGRPKKPMSSYFLFAQTKRESFHGKDMKEFQEKVKTEWQKLSEADRLKYEKQAQDLMKKYKKDLEAWELKMISMGRTDLIRTKPVREKRKSEEVKDKKKAQP